MKWNLKLLRALMKFGFPAYIVLIPTVAFYGLLKPWISAVPILSTYEGQFPITIGFGYRAEHSQNASHRYVSRSYILVPSVFLDPKTLIVSQTDSEPPVLTEQRYGFLLQFGWIVVCFFGTWWFWFRPGRIAQQGAQLDGPANGGTSG